MGVRSGTLIRNITVKECPWISTEFKVSTKVYLFTGCTYGCMGRGIAVSLPLEPTTAIEVPRNAVAWDNSSCS